MSSNSSSGTAVERSNGSGKSSLLQENRASAKRHSSMRMPARSQISKACSLGVGNASSKHGAIEPYLRMLEAISQLCRHGIGKRVIAILHSTRRFGSCNSPRY